MLTVKLNGRTLNSWVDGVSTSGVARFMRHHLHHLVCDHEPVLETCPKVKFTNHGLFSIPFNAYTLYGGKSLLTLTVTPTLIQLSGVDLIKTPDRFQLYADPMAVTRFQQLLGSADRRVAVYALGWTRARLRRDNNEPTLLPWEDEQEWPTQPIDRNIRIDYKILTSTQPVKHHTAGWKCIGIMDIDTGIILPDSAEVV